jgi:hypothetical protein
MYYNYKDLMTEILYKWDNSMFLYGGDIGHTAFTNIYELLGYEYCSEFLADKFFIEFNNNTDKNHTLDGMKGLHDKDKKLLIQYSDYLFNTIKVDKYILLRYMLKLVLLVNRYNQSHYKDTMNKDIKKIMHKKYLNYGKTEKINIFKKRVYDIIELMGGMSTFYEETQEFKKELIEAYNNPSLYVVHRLEDKIQLNTADIKNYLVSLKLPTKNTDIENFINDLNKKTI